MALLKDVQSYIKNVGKSIVYASAEAASKKAPVFQDYIETNQDTVREWLDDLRDMKGNSGRLNDALSKNDWFQAGKIIMDNTIKDLKTGKWYTDDEELDAMADDMMASFEDDFDTDYGLKTGDDTDTSSLDTPVKETPDLTQAKIISRTVMGGSQAISNSVISGAKYVGENVRSASKIAYLQNVKSIGIMTTGFENVTVGLKNIVEFNMNVMKVHIDNSTKFFQNTTDLLTKQNAMLEEMLNMQRNLYKKEQENEKKYESNYNKIVTDNGAINLGGLWKNFMGNISNQVQGLEFLKDPEMIKIAFAHPMQFLAEGMANMMMGPILSNSLEQLNKTVSGIAGNLVARANNPRYGQSWLADLMGLMFKTNIKDKNSINTSNYNKGPMQYNGMANKSLIEVIPGYLARIESALTGGPERIYNFETGRWTTIHTVAEDFLNRRASFGRDAMSELSNEFNYQLGSINFGKNSKAKDLLAADIDKFFQYLIRRKGDQSGMILKADGTLKNKNLWKDIGVSSPQNMELIATIFHQTNVATRMMLAHNIITKGYDARNEFMQNMEGSPTALNLFNGAYGMYDVPDIEKRYKGADISRGPATEFRPANNAIELLKAIHKQITISRYILQSGDISTRRGISESMAEQGINGDIKVNPNWDDKYKSEFGQEMQSEVKHNQTSLDQYTYDANIVEREGGVDYTDPELRHKLRALGPKNRRQQVIDEYNSGMLFEYDEDAYKKYKGNNIFQKLRNADGIDEKFGVINAFLEHLRNKPANFLANMINKVDETIYSFFYENESDRKDENGKPIKGFFNNMLYDAEQIFNKVGDQFKKFVIDPFKKTLDDFKKSKFFQDLKNAFKNNLRGIKNTVFGAFSSVFGGGNKQQPTGQEMIANDASGVWTGDEDEIEEAKATGGYVPKTGLYVLSRGEKVVPSFLNPDYPYRSNLRTDRQNEQKVLRAAGRGRARIFGAYAAGTGANADAIVSTSSQINGYMEEMKQNGTQREKRVVKQAEDSVLNDFKRLFPDAFSSGTIGGIAGLLTLGPVGMIGGMLLGSAMSLSKNMKSFNEFLFGKDLENGKHKEGLLDGTFFADLKKHFPDIKNFGIVGGTLGGLASLLTGSPIGLIGGAVLGGAFGFVKSSDEAQKTLFGESGKFKLPKKLDDYLKNHMTRNLVGMGLGGLGLGAVTGSPLGIVGGMLIGGGLSYLSTTDKFTDMLLGKKNKDGKREGGVIGNIKKYVVDPLAERAVDARKSFEKYLKKEIFEPLRNGIRPMFKATSIVISKVAKTVGNYAMKMIKSNGLLLMKNSVLGKILKSPAGMGAATALAVGSQFGPVYGVLAGLGVGAMRSEWGRDLFGKVVSFIPKQIEKVGGRVQQAMINRGWETEMTAKDRIAFMNDRGKYDYKNRAVDEMLMTSTKEQIQSVQTLLKDYKTGKTNTDQAYYNWERQTIIDLQGMGASSSLIKKIIKTIKDNPMKSDSDADSFKNRILRLVEKENLDYTTREKVASYAVNANRSYNLQVVGLKKALSSGTSTQEYTRQAMKTMGIDLKKTNVDDMLKQVESEIKSRESMKEDPVKVANKNTDRMIASMRVSQSIELGIFKLLAGHRLNNEDLKQINDSIQEANAGGVFKKLGLDTFNVNTTAASALMTNDQIAAQNKLGKDMSDWTAKDAQNIENYYIKKTKFLTEDNIKSKSGSKIKDTLYNIQHKTGDETIVDSLNYGFSKGIYTYDEIENLLDSGGTRWFDKNKIKRYASIIRELASVGIKVTMIDMASMNDKDWKALQELIKLANEGKIYFDKDLTFNELATGVFYISGDDGKKYQMKASLEKLLNLYNKFPFFIYHIKGLVRIANTTIFENILNDIKRLSDTNKYYDPETQYLKRKFTEFVRGNIDINQMRDAIKENAKVSELVRARTSNNNATASVTEGAPEGVKKKLQKLGSGMVGKNRKEAAKALTEAGKQMKGKVGQAAATGKQLAGEFAATVSENVAAGKDMVESATYQIGTALTLGTAQFFENMADPEVNSKLASILANAAGGDVSNLGISGAVSANKNGTVSIATANGEVVNYKKTTDGGLQAADKDSKKALENIEEDRSLRKDIAESLGIISDSIKNRVGGIAAKGKKVLDKAKSGGGLFQSIADLIMSPLNGIAGLLRAVTAVVMAPFTVLGLGGLAKKIAGAIFGKIKDIGSKFKKFLFGDKKLYEIVMKTKFGKILFGGAALGAAYLGMDNVFGNESGGEDTNQGPSGTSIGGALALGGLAAENLIGKKFGPIGKFLGIGGKAAEKAGLETTAKVTAKGAEKLTYKAGSVAAEAAGNAVGKISEKQAAAIMAEANPSKASQYLGTAKQKAADLAKNSTIVNTIKKNVENSIVKVAKFVNSHFATGPLKWLPNAINKFAAALLTKMESPEIVAKIAKKAGLDTAFTVAGTGIGALTFGVGLAFLKGMQIGYWAIQGWNEAGEYFGVQNPSILQKIIAAFCNGILGTSWAGIVFDGGDLLALFKPFLPAFIFEDPDKAAEKAAQNPENQIDFGGKMGGDFKETTFSKSLKGWFGEKSTDFGNEVSALNDRIGKEQEQKKQEQQQQNQQPQKPGFYDSVVAPIVGGISDLFAQAEAQAAENIAKRNAARAGQGKYGRGRFYSQLDPKNAMQFNAFGDTEYQDMSDSGCGPVSAANAASALGMRLDPKAAARFALSGGYKEQNGGTTPNYFGDVLGQMGICTQNISGSNASIMGNLASGNPVILMGQDSTVSSKNPYGPGPHYVTATGIDGRGNIIVQDPESRTPNKRYRAGDVLSKSSIAIAAGRGKRLRYKFGREKKNVTSDIPETIWKFLKGKGLDDVVVAAIMGNIYAESAYNPGAQNPGSGAFGLCQWLGSRRDNLVALASRLGTPVTDVTTQLNHLWNEIGPGGDESGALASTENAAKSGGVDAATRVFGEEFERPSAAELASSLSKRVNAARDALQKKGKGIVVDGSYDTDTILGGSSIGGAKKSSGGILGMFDSIASALDVSKYFNFGFGKHHRFGRGDEKSSTQQTQSGPTGNELFGISESSMKNVSNMASAIGQAAATEFGNIGSSFANVAKSIYGDTLMNTFFGSNPFSSSSSSNSGSNGQFVGNAPAKFSGKADESSALKYMLSTMPGSSITEHYGVSRGDYIHAGTDIGANIGTPIYSPVNGKVYDLGTQTDGSGNPTGFGNYIQIQDKNGNFHMFPHISTWNDGLAKGSTVSKGDLLAYVGSTGTSTGPHLHYEIDPPSNPGAVTSGSHIDPGIYNISGLGKTLKRVASNNKAALRYIDPVSKKRKVVPPNSEAVAIYGKGPEGGTTIVNTGNGSVDYSDKFDAIITALGAILVAIQNGGMGGGNAAPALTPSATFGGGATNLGESFSRQSITDIIGAMQSIAAK